MAHDILIVDDEADIRMLIGGVLKDEGYATRDAADTAQALAEIQARQPTLVILDIWLQGSGLEGIEILKQLRAEMPSVPVVMISGHGTIETAVEAIKIGAYDFLEKPFKSDRLLLIVERAIEAAQLRRENEELKLRAGGDIDLVGASAAANQLRQQIERAAPTGSRVMITGPPGSGKEVVGRLLHSRSRRSKGPFVPVNCATMRPERLEIELFGTETRIDGGPRKVGNFERAHGGTLFLDEVADMPIETQSKIVRALQAYTWPGNVRQLRNVIDWLLIMAPGDAREQVRADMLPNEITAIAPTVVKWDKGSEIMTLPLRDAREVFEREYLLAQVTRFGGNISRTAAFVGMERSALHRKLKSLGVFGNDRPLRVGT